MSLEFKVIKRVDSGPLPWVALSALHIQCTVQQPEKEITVRYLLFYHYTEEGLNKLIREIFITYTIIS